MMKSQPIEPVNLSQKHGLLASRDQNTAFAAQGRREWFRENRWGIVIALLILALPPFYFAYMTASNLRTLDALRAPAQEAQAYIVSKNAIPTGIRMTSMRYDVTFRLNGQEVTATTLNAAKWMKTPTDTTVPVTYHIGKNGEVLISDWQPTPAK